MKILKRINGIRGALMRMLTSGMMVSTFTSEPVANIEVRTILICRPNHRLGNLLMVTPLLQEVIATFPHARIDLFVKGTVAPSLFQNYANINRIIQLPKKPFKSPIRYLAGWITIRMKRYDLAINTVNHSASGRLSTQFANSKYKFLGDVDEDTRLRFSDSEHMAKYPVYSFRKNLSRLGLKPNQCRVATLDLKLTPDEIGQGKRLANELVKNDKKIICLFTYATGEKCYSASWWTTFFAKLNAEYDEYNIIEILPVENVSQIGFVAPSFYSKNVREIASLIANTDVFIGADSGMMHLASATKTPTIGLFQKLNSQVYKPYNHNSVAINTGTTNSEECIRILNRVLFNDYDG